MQNQVVPACLSKSDKIVKDLRRIISITVQFLSTLNGLENVHLVDLSTPTSTPTLRLRYATLRYVTPTLPTLRLRYATLPTLKNISLATVATVATVDTVGTTSHRS